MKINFPILDEPISLEHSTILSVESIEVFASLVREFYYYSDESRLKLFDGKLKSLKPSELMIVTDILGYNLNSTAVLKLVYNDLEKQLNDNLEAKAEIERLIEYIQLSNLRVLFIEPRKIEGFQQYVLDEDFCLLLDSGVKAE